MMGNTLGEIFIQGGWVMWPLLFCSILMGGVLLDRAYVFITLWPKLSKLTESLTQSLRDGDPNSARQIAQTQPPLLREVFLGALDTKRPRDAAERLTDRNRQKLAGHLKKNLWILGTIGSASPFIGLLGTVVGIVRAFGDMAEQGAGGFSVVAGGISEALIATGFGLVVAILSLLIYNIFVTFANQATTGLKLSLDEILETSFEKVGA